MLGPPRYKTSCKPGDGYIGFDNYTASHDSHEPQKQNCCLRSLQGLSCCPHISKILSQTSVLILRFTKANLHEHTLLNVKLQTPLHCAS